jgi:hypothetical protein
MSDFPLTVQYTLRTPFRPNENKISCAGRRRASLWVKGFSHLKAEQYDGPGSAASIDWTFVRPLYLSFERLRVGVTGFAARATSSFVNTAKRNGCDSRK